MVRTSSLLWLVAAATSCAAAEVPDRLPQPDFVAQPSDPAWLVRAVQFHGHLGPSAVAGARIGMAGLRAVEAKGYFDVEVVCEGPFAKPPQACFLDGIQVGTGATLGKRTLHWIQTDRIAVRFKNTRTGKTATLHPTPALVAMLASVKPEPRAARQEHADHTEADARLETLARKIAAMPRDEIIATEEAR